MNPSSVGATCDISSGMTLPEQRDHLHELGIAFCDVAFEHRRRAQRQQTDHRPHLEALRAARPADAAGRRRSRPPRPTSRRGCRQSGPWRTQIHMKCWRNLKATSSYIGSYRPGSARSPACSGSRTPSMPCRPPVRASRRSEAAALRSKTPMLSRPRKPPANTLRPVGSLRLTHQLKLSMQPLERALEETHVGAAQRPLQVEQEQRGPGVHRRVDVAEVPLVGRNLAVRMRSTGCAASAGAAPWRSRSRPARARSCGTPGPMRRTTGTPICRASR